MEIRLAQPGDLTGWLQLVEPMRRFVSGAGDPREHGGLCPGHCRGDFPAGGALCSGKRNDRGVLAFSRDEMSWPSSQYPDSTAAGGSPGS